jgi:hypothetical protein
MRRSFRALAALALLGAIGCQDYNFNPVGQCYIQPGTKRVRLADVSTADILFVVDDSGSMRGEQDALGSNFSYFVDRLDQINVDRAARALEPIDFHVAVTTTGVFINQADTAQDVFCQATCGSAAGPICCVTSDTPNVPLRVPRPCDNGGGCGSGYSCRTTCTGYAGEQICCDSGGNPELRNVTCGASEVGQECGKIYRRYSCSSGVGVSGEPYPRGNFVSFGTNPKVLHFDKSLYGPGGVNDQGYTAQQLMDFFARETSPGSGVYEGNVIVGTCGPGQEQGFTAAKLAIEKALAGDQPGVPRSEWPHSGAKMVVVFVGDEDDCSSPESESPSQGIIYGTGASGNPCTGSPKLYPTTTYSGFLSGLGRPLGTAFVVSAHAPGTDRYATCTDFDCVAGLCCASACGGCGASNCGGQQEGVRFLEMRDQLGAGASPASDIVAGSICDPNFGTILERVADIVKPPDVLELPTPPASDVLTVLRIVDRAGLTSKTCVGPAGAGLTEAQAAATGCGGGPCDWWFVADRSGSRDSLQVSQFVYINPASTYCQANPGETYSADYLGRLPEDGCTSANDCVAALGGSLADWTCEVPIVGQPGTCVCGG